MDNAFSKLTDTELIALYRVEKHKHFSGYMGAKRKALVEKWGFDTKNASHLIRLLKMGIEFLSTGELQVHREDNSYLVDIKQGKYTLEQIKTEAERLFKVSETAFVNSTLPSKIDKKKVENLLVEILERELHGGSE